VLASPGFARSERLSRLLRFVVERHLEGRDTELKESLIAIEVFGRPPGHDPKVDSIVRSEAARLRSRLIEYYAGEGSTDPVVIELPKGGYTPRFRQPETAPTRSDANKTRSRRVWLVAALASLVMFLAATVGWWVKRESAPVAIAVLPLENLSHDPANDYFADGLTDELIRNLSLIDGLAPRSRTSSFAFKGQPRNVREVGKQLAADYILEGSVLRAGHQLRINVQLIRVRDDFPLWTGRYEREVTDVFIIQDEISRGVVNNLRLKLGSGRRRYETSVEAFDLYLRARAAKGQSLVLLLPERVRLYQEAIARDSTFAPAYAGLASTYAFRSGFGGLPELDLPDELAKMRAAAEKAIQLDPLLAEAHAAQGAAYARDAQWEQSEKSFRRALAIDPNSSNSRDLFTIHLLLPLGRVAEAVRQMRLAERADPLSAEVHNDLAYALRSAGRYDEAASHCEKAANRAQCLSRTLLAQGKIAEAIDVLVAGVNRGVPPGDPSRGYLGYAYARAGRRAEAEQIARTLAPFAVQQALVFAGLGDKERTLDALDRATVLGPVRIGRALVAPEFALVRVDSRVKALRKRVGLPE
jgi:TolB-like protein/Flp pilus assembly protein TadD